MLLFVGGFWPFNLWCDYEITIRKCRIYFSDSSHLISNLSLLRAMLVGSLRKAREKKTNEDVNVWKKWVFVCIVEWHQKETRHDVIVPHWHRQIRVKLKGQTHTHRPATVKRKIIPEISTENHDRQIVQITMNCSKNRENSRQAQL